MTASKKDLTMFRSKHNRNVVLSEKVKLAFAAMLKKDGAEAWEYEMEFARLADISNQDCSKLRERFADHVVPCKTVGRSTNGNVKFAWFADPKVANKARNED